MQEEGVGVSLEGPSEPTNDFQLATILLSYLSDENQNKWSAQDNKPLAQSHVCGET